MKNAHLHSQFPWRFLGIWLLAFGHSARAVLLPRNSPEISFAAVAFLNDSLRMGMRREARERAVQFLFQYDLNKAENLDDALKQFWDSQRSAALQEEKGKARWGETIELPPPTSEEA